jgi:hypothetical protein
MSEDADRTPDDAYLEAGGLLVPSGVDRAQIEAMLDLSPEHRLRLLEDWIDGIEELRRLAAAGGGLGTAR